MKSYRFDFPIIAWMLACHLLAVPAFFSLSWENFTIFLIANFISTCLGITLGFHRLISHRSLKTHTFTKRLLATCGALALQRGPITWAATHRTHHAKSDHDGDPHDSRRGLFFSHMGWLLVKNPDLEDLTLRRRMTRDLQNDPYLRFIDQIWVQILMQVILGLSLLYFGGWQWMIWGVFFRLTFCYHATWTINSLTHWFGYKRFHSNDNSRNNIITALFTWGEGWHNTHHAHERMARHGIATWEIDITWYIIVVMEALGLAWDVQRLPKDAEQDACERSLPLVHKLRQRQATL